MFAASITLLTLLGQDGHLPSESGEAKAKARVLLKQGAQHYQRAEFADALANFQSAYEIFRSPKLLLNIGQCSRELGRPVEAIVAFEQFLTEAHGAPERAVAEAKVSVEELSTQVGKLLIECPIVGAEIKLDGKKIGVAPLKDLVRATVGRHQLLAVYENAQPIMKNAYVTAGAVETVVLRSKTIGDAVGSTRGSNGAGTRIALRSSKHTTPVDDGWLLGRTWTWVAAGSAVVLAGGAAAAGLEMRSKFAALDQTCGRAAGVNYPGCKSGDLGALNAWKTTANVLWGLSAAAALTAGVVFYVEGRGLEVAPTVGTEIGFVASMRY